MKREIIIHAGFPKCASTFLQKQIFPQLKNYEFVDGAPYADLGTLYLEDISKTSPVLKLPEKENVVISLEDYMHYDLPMAWRKYGNWARKDIFISNIKKLFLEKGKFIFVIRKQDSLIESWLKYEPFFRKGEYFFLDWPMTSSVLDKYEKEHKGKKYGYDVKIYKKSFPVNKYGVTYTHTFDYFDIFKRIAAGIDKKRICILLIEDLHEEPEKFYFKLGDFLGEDLSHFVGSNIPKENVSQNTAEIRNPIVQKLFAPSAHLAPKFLRKFSRQILSQKASLSEKFKKEIMSLYKENNQRLAQDFDLDLERYDYF